MSLSHHKKFSAQGFTLVEVLLASSVLAIGLLSAGLLAGQIEEGHDIVGHAAFDLGKNAAVGAIKRVVQVENPTLHMPEIRPEIGGWA